MRLKQRSLKAKEKFADSLLATYNAIIGAIVISVFVFPLATFLSSLSDSSDPFTWSLIYDQLTWLNVGVFAIVYLVPIFIAVWMRYKAMDLYDEVAKSTRQ